MSLSAKLRRAPLRLSTGAYILNSGVAKLSADEETAKQLHGAASGTYGFLGKIDPKVFTKMLAAGEITVGSALLLPVVPPLVAGGALIGFSGLLLNVYWNTPGMHEPGDPRPTHQGTAMSKDIWMFGAGTGLVVDALLEPAHDKKVELVSTVSEKRAARSRQVRKARRKAKKSNQEFVSHALVAAKQVQADATDKAQKVAKRAQKRADKASKRAAKRFNEARDEYGPVVAQKTKLAVDAARGFADEYGPVVAEKAKHARDAAKDLADEYRPVVAEKAKQARGAAKDLADEYGPVVAERAKQARDTAKDLADEYGPVVAEKAKAARDAAQDAAQEASKRARAAANR